MLRVCHGCVSLDVRLHKVVSKVYVAIRVLRNAMGDAGAGGGLVQAISALRRCTPVWVQRY